MLKLLQGQTPTVYEAIQQTGAFAMLQQSKWHQVLSHLSQEARLYVWSFYPKLRYLHFPCQHQLGYTGYQNAGDLTLG
jgi:hypothetical protein